MYVVIDVALVFLLLTLNIFTPFSSVSIVDFEHVNVSREDATEQQTFESS